MGDWHVVSDSAFVVAPQFAVGHEWQQRWHALEERETVVGVFCLLRGRFGCMGVAVRWRPLNGSECVAACFFVAVGAWQARTSFGQIPL